MIKKLSLISLFTLLPASFYFAQTTVFAYLKDADGKPVESAEVDLKGSGNDVKADKIGYFQFVDLKSGHYQIVITKPSYETKVMEFDVNQEKRKVRQNTKVRPRSAVIVLKETDQRVSCVANNAANLLNHRLLSGDKHGTSHQHQRGVVELATQLVEVSKLVGNFTATVVVGPAH